MRSTARHLAVAAGAALGVGALLLAVRPAIADVPEATTTRAFAHDAGGPVGTGPDGPAMRARFARRVGAERIARYLELTPAQEDAIRALVERHRASVEPVAAERRSLHEQLRSLVDRGDADPAAVGRVVLELAGQRRELRASREALADQIAGVLEGEQKVKWQHLRELRQAGGPRRFGQGRS